MEEVPARELARRGWVCSHQLVRGAQAQSQGEESARTPRRRVIPREDECKKMKEQIDALEKKNEQLKKTLQESSPTPRGATSTPDPGENEMDMDANFDVMAKHLLRKIVALASQSLEDQTKVTTLHRWKLMKEVELSDLVDRLCTMMMEQSPREFVPSTEFHWAADILARDVMKEVRCQIRREQRVRERDRARLARRERATQSQVRPATHSVPQPGPEEMSDVGHEPTDSRVIDESLSTKPSPVQLTPQSTEYIDEDKVSIIKLQDSMG